MTGPNLTRRAVTLLAPFGLMGLASCGFFYDAGLETDAEFQAMVEGVMPDLRLTSAITGRPVIRSPGFALFGVDYKLPRETLARNFLALHEETGLRSFTLYAGSSHYGNYWRVDIPGCDAGSCVDLVPSLNFVDISELEHRHFNPGYVDSTGTEIERHVILEADLNGVSYQAEVGVLYDNQGRVITYWVLTGRVTINQREHDWVIRYGPDNNRPTHPVEVYEYVHNMALGLSVFRDDGPRNSSNPEMGL